MNTEVLDKINNLEEKYCRDCILKKLNREKGSRTAAHNFCIKECSVGISIRTHGNNLQ
ncbi:zinc-finger domain-containing protein [Salinicoccus albus]|uniref:zinc-finger domain-containing protein n=1 Tax=Salinicoccus albus TaxID=418756 RepID=UPI0003798C8D|nr:zinc-finger domain-containing protein [Salinicoccus albus]